MSNEQERELEKAETWDFEQPKVKEPVKASRVVVSVAFRRDDFVRVSEYAERIRKRLSEFIREAAIEKATALGGGTLVYDSGSPGTVWWPEQMLVITRAVGSPVDYPAEPAATTY